MLRLLTFSRPNRAVASGITSAALLAVSVLLGAALATPSPEQQVVAYLGSTEAVIGSAATGPAAPPGARAELPTWGGALRGLRVERHDVVTGSVVTQRASGGYDWANYLETSWPAAPLAGTYVVLSGRAPQAAGECLRTPTVAPDASLPFDTALSIVGEARSLAQPQLLALICAPGTWAQWHIPVEYAPLARYGTKVTTYLTGPDTAVALAAIRAWPGLDPTVEVMSRGDLHALFSRLTPQRFLATWVPLMGLPFGMGILLGGSFGLWAAGITRQLHDLGLPRRRLLVAAMLSVAVTTSVGAGLGTLIAIPLSWLWRPLVPLWNGGAQVGDASVPTGLLVMVVIASLSGGILGAAVGMLGGLRGRNVTARQATALRPREQAALLGGALLVAAASASLVSTSSGQTWPMAGGALLGSLAFSFLSALALARAGGVLQRSTSPLRAIAGRLLHDDSRRWGLGVLALTTFVGALATTFIYVTSSAAALLPFMASRVPAGVTVLQVQDPTGTRVPATLIADFEAAIGVSSPISIREEYYGKGPIWSFASVADLERITGPLPPSTHERLHNGVVLSQKVVREEPLVLMNFGTSPPRHTTAIPLTAEKTRRYAHPAGFALASALPAPAGAPSVERLVYLGLTPDSDQRAGQFALERGLTGVEVFAYSGEAEATWPLWTTISLAGFALLTLVVIALAARREVAALRPLLGAFVALGLPKRWLRAVILPLVLLFASTCSLFALGGGLYALALLAATYPAGVFDAAGVPWWLLGLFLLSIPLSALGAGLLLTRGSIPPTLTSAEP